MRLIDVAIPQFDPEPAEASRPGLSNAKSSAFRLPSGYFGTTEEEYGVDDEEEDVKPASAPLPPSDSDADIFFEASQGDEVEASTLLVVCSNF